MIVYRRARHKQTQADAGTYLFTYTLGTNGKVTETEATNPGGVRRRANRKAKAAPIE